jgi:hypothetical protein
MPFDPNSPFGSIDPSQWWRLRTLPHILVQPNAPPNAASGNPAGADGIDDWFVPGRAPNPADLPNDWFVPWSAQTNAAFPDDWIYPDGRSAPTSAVAPSAVPPAPGPQPNAANPATANRLAPPPAPFAAYWSLIPASRVGALAWEPPIFPDSFGQFPPAMPTPSNDPPRFAVGGLLGAIPRMCAAAPLNISPRFAPGGLLGAIPRMCAPASPADPLAAAANGILGAIAKLPATRASLDIPPNVIAQGSLGGTAKLQQANGPLPYQPGLPDVGNDPSDPIDALRTLHATPTGLPGPSAPPSSPGGSFIPPSFGADQSTLNGAPTATHAAYIYPSPLDQILPCFVSSIGCAGGGGGNRGGGGDGPAAPRPSLPSAPRSPAPAPRSVGEGPELTEGDAGAREVAPTAPAGGGSSPSPLGRGKQYEQKYGSQQTTRHVVIDGRDATVRLDFPPDENGIVDLKDYNWSNPGYQVPFIQQKVIENFQAQIRRYQAVHPKIRFQFSVQPPPWIERALEDAGGTYFVKP